MNAPAETAPANTAYLKVLDALVQINEPAERNHIARRAGISPDDAGVQLVALAGNRIVVRCPQPKGAPALWSLAVSLSTARQMVEGMKRAAAEAGPGADDRRRIIAAMREIGAPASAFGIAKKSGVEMSNFSLFLEEMAADGVIQRIGGTSGQRPKFALIPSVQSQTPAATDGEPGDGSPGEDHEDEGTAACAGDRCGIDCAAAGADKTVAYDVLADAEVSAGEGFDDPGDDAPDEFRDGDDKPAVADDPYGLDYDPRAAEAEAVAYDALVEAEAAADEAPLAGEDVNSDADVLDDRRERYTDQPADPDTPLGYAIARVTGPMIREAEEWEGQAAHSRYVAANAASLAQEIALRMGGFDDAAEVLAVALRIVEEVE